jgi:peptidoglycan/LPS O-acetylase OafA/YrhL
MWAGLGVEVFFVLSGFLITDLLLREHAATGRLHYRRFYARRALRIFPAYWVFLLLSAGLLRALDHPTALGRWLLDAGYLGNYAKALDPAGLPLGPFSHVWSLAAEEQF